MSKSVSVIALTHDLVRKQSIATMVWDNDPEKRISLPVPFGCDLAQLQGAAEQSMREFAAEAQAIVVKAKAGKVVIPDGPEVRSGISI